MYPLRFPSEGVSLAAVSQNGRRIIEACMNRHHSRSDHSHTEYLQHTSNEAYAKTENFLDDMKKAVDIREPTGANPALYIYLLAVEEAASKFRVCRSVHHHIFN
jgi:hypothetical protein